MPRLDPSAVYAQIVPAGQFSTDYRVRILLPYGPTSMPSDVRSSWPAVERALARAIRIARNDGATELPNQLDDCLAVEMTVSARAINDPSINLMQLLTPDIQRTVIAALKHRDEDRKN